MARFMLSFPNLHPIDLHHMLVETKGTGYGLGPDLGLDGSTGDGDQGEVNPLTCHVVKGNNW